MILLFPLGGIDRRDLFSSLMYLLFLSFAAVVLFFALPSVLITDTSDLQNQIVTLMILAAVSLLRWNWGLKSQKNQLNQKKDVA